MSEWSKTILRNHIDKVVDNRGKNPPYMESGYPVIETGCISGNNKFPNLNLVKKYVDQETYDSWFRSGHPEQGDLLIITVGNGIGSCAIYKDGNGCITQNLIGIRPIKEELSSEFLYYYLSQNELYDFLQSLNIGSAQPSLKVPHILGLEIPYPPLPEQKAIASVLSSLDDKIDLLHRQNKTLEAMAETLFRQWFIEEAKEDWEEVTLADVCTRITDGSHSSPASVEDGYPMASVKDMYDWGINQSTCRKISKEDYEVLVQADCKALQGDILIAKDGSYLKHVFLMEESLDVVLLSSIAMLRPNGQYHPMLLTLFLKLDSTHELMQNIVTGAVIPRIVLKDFRKFSIQLPPKDLQDKAVKIVKPIFEKCWENNRQIQTLENLRDTLLPKLMSGEVRVQYQTEEVA